MAVAPMGGKEPMGDRVSRFVARLRQLITGVFAQTEVREEEIQKQEQAQRDRATAPVAGPTEAGEGGSAEDDQIDEANGEDATE